MDLLQVEEGAGMIFELTTTKTGEPCVVMYDSKDKHFTIAKMYPSPDGTKIRIVLPELKSFKQARIDIDSHYIEFERKA